MRWTKRLEEEIAFSRLHGFEFMQVWYKDGEIALDRVEGSKEQALKDCGFPFVIHALLELSDWDDHIPRILQKLQFLGHTDLIIHPICSKQPITPASMDQLCQKVSAAHLKFSDAGVRLFLENNSKIDPIHYLTHEVERMFRSCPGLGFLLDVAHIDSYQHLAELVAVQSPEYLHVADKHFGVPHEHLPLGQGDIDWDSVFQGPLAGFEGKIILEVTQTDAEIVESRRVLDEIFRKRELC